MHYSRWTMLVGFCGLISCGSHSNKASLAAQAAQDVPAPQDKTLAYLDARARGWFKKTDWNFVEGGQCAISCHTTVPYMLGNKFDTPQSQAVAKELRDIITPRVNNWQNTLPLYTWAAVTSRATEVVLNSVILLLYDIKLNKTLSTESCKAVDIMWNMFNTDRELHWLDENLAPWEDQGSNYWALTLIALVLEQTNRKFTAVEQQAACTPNDTHNAARKRLFAMLKAGRATANLHDQTWHLWVDLFQQEALLNTDERQSTVVKILAKQLPDGGFRLKDFIHPQAGHPTFKFAADPYMTAIIVTILRAATGKVNFDPQALVKAEGWLKTIAEGGIENKMFPSVNKPNSVWNSNLFKDAAIAYSLITSAPK